MLKSEFQGKDFIEILNPGLKDPLVNCKTAGSNGIQKVYDKEIKGSIFTLDGIPTVNRISIPKDSKQGLGLVQRCVVFQLEIRTGQDFSMEISASDLNHNKRNLLFSTSHKDLNIQPLSARIPLKNINRGQWMNLVIDVASFITDIWKNQTFKIIDSLTVCANCKLRKIFSLKNVPSVELGLLPDTIIHQVDFPSGTDYKLQILTLNDCRPSETVELTRLNSFDSTLSDSNSKLKNSYKIAFGTKVSVQNQQLNERSLLKIEGVAKNGNNETASNEYDEDVLGNSNSSLKQSKLKLTRINNTNTKIQRINSSNSAENNNNEGNSFLETKKYPNPQPPAGSAKPSPSARKARLSAKNTQNKPSNVNTNDKQPVNEINENIINTTNNINNNNSLNESVTDLIQAFKFNDNKNNISSQQQQVIPQINKTAIKISPLQPKPPVATQMSEKQDSLNVYSFSSKPKVVDLVENRKNQQQTKTYDFRKYISNSPMKQKEKNEDIIITDFEKSGRDNIIDEKLDSVKINENNNKQLSISEDAKPFSIFSLLNEPINVRPNYQNIEQKNDKIPHQLNVTDSFEANLLKQLKEEMEEIPTKKATLKPVVTKSKNSPIMFDNSNTSDKLYNYQVITNSCDTESTASVLRKQIAEARFHNYDNEMNTTTTAGINVHKSTTRDYSVMRSLLHSNSPNVFKNPINEERRYEVDSQATDNVSENSEDELNLVWDETLNCFYDPKTSTYYDMKA